MYGHYLIRMAGLFSVFCQHAASGEEMNSLLHTRYYGVWYFAMFVAVYKDLMTHGQYVK